MATKIKARAKGRCNRNPRTGSASNGDWITQGQENEKGNPCSLHSDTELLPSTVKVSQTSQWVLVFPKTHWSAYV